MDETPNSEGDNETNGERATSRQWSDWRSGSFYRKSFGSDADEAFDLAVETMFWACDAFHGILDKKDLGYVVISEEEHRDKPKAQYAWQLIEEGDDRVADIEAPAGAINLSGTHDAREYRERRNLKGKQGSVWLFFGTGYERVRVVGRHRNRGTDEE
ncbi:hypothetical protein [Halococcus saccharolyticus]|uniref:Uncharacterized protein n=1 Tax=Halococcus saccharolyticus DSM 5350 TaxID=1227455 RepID=M0ML24_9EURY|nr:hypothetical protein [Halococcus saccharolyticus]EMA46058.1 hypothetical protein C449_05117 [Halococcus saccharolyticus DSM 5350]